MTRPAGASDDHGFDHDPAGAALAVLRRAGSALSAAEVKQALRAGGVDPATTDRAWPAVRRKLRDHEHVVVEPGNRYRFTAEPPALSAAAALDRLAEGGLTAGTRASLAAVVRAALAAPVPGPPADRRQIEIPLVRALAELAIEVEQLTVNEASAAAMIHRVRARVKRVGLEPIDQAGAESTHDRTRHEPIGRPIGDGTPVVVVRPGYVWKAPTGDVLIARAVVQDRS